MKAPQKLSPAPVVSNGIRTARKGPWHGDVPACCQVVGSELPSAPSLITTIRGPSSANVRGPRACPVPVGPGAADLLAKAGQEDVALGDPGRERKASSLPAM